MKNSQIATTQLSLPKGGGAIQGIGETFQANEFTGTTALSIPIATTPCRSFEPQMSIEYSSGSGNGIFGLGFSLSIPNISRKTSKGIPQYNESDTFLFSNAEDLVPLIDGDSTNSVKGYKIITYRPRLEGLFAKIEHWVNEETKDSYWQVVSKENVTSIFGKTEDARISDPENPKRIFQWLLQETFNAKGDRIFYEYKGENSSNVPDAMHEENRCQTANKYIQKIKYGNVQPFQTGQVPQDNWLFEVVFDYGEYGIDPNKSNPYAPIQEWANRQDPFSTYHARFEIRTHRLCRRILMFHHFQELGEQPTLVHATCFNYQASAVVSLLNKVESVGYRYEQGNYQQKNLPPLKFKYTNFDPTKQTFLTLLEESRGKGNDGCDLLGLCLSPNYQLIDLYGEGIPGILYSDGKATLYWEPQEDGDKPGTKVSYAAPKIPSQLPIESQNQSINPLLMDLTGNGQLELVVNTPAYTGYYQVNSDRQPGEPDIIRAFFWQYWQQNQDYLYRCCVKWMGGNSIDAEDALSRAMLKAWEKAQKFAGKIANFKAWLTTLTRNLCVDIHRERSRGETRVENIEGYASSEEQELVSPDETPESALEADEKKILIRRAIDNLPTRLRETFILHFYRELSYQEIAQKQDISYQNVCKRISQTRKILQEELRGYFIEEDGTDRDKSIPPTATESEIGEWGVEAEGGETLLAVAVEEVEIVGDKEAQEVGRDVQQSELVMVAVTAGGKLEVKNGGCRWVEVVLWRQKQHQVGKVAGEFVLVLVRSSRSPPWYFLFYFQSFIKGLLGMMMRVRFF